MFVDGLPNHPEEMEYNKMESALGRKPSLFAFLARHRFTMSFVYVHGIG